MWPRRDEWERYPFLFTRRSYNRQQRWFAAVEHTGTEPDPYAFREDAFAFWSPIADSSTWGQHEYCAESNSVGDARGVNDSPGRKERDRDPPDTRSSNMANHAFKGRREQHFTVLLWSDHITDFVKLSNTVKASPLRTWECEIYTEALQLPSTSNTIPSSVSNDEITNSYSWCDALFSWGKAIVAFNLMFIGRNQVHCVIPL